MKLGPRMTASQRVRALDELRPAERERITVTVLAGGASLEAACALVAVVLAIVGLAGIAAHYAAGLAALAIACGAIVAGGSVVARWKREIAGSLGAIERAELAGGLGADLIGGAIGAVLAIVALAGNASRTMLPIAAIVFGIARLLGGAVRPRVATLIFDADRAFDLRSRLAVEAATALTLVVALASVVLGVLGLVGVVPRVLSLVASLALGIAMLLAGSAETIRFAHRRHELN